MKILITGGAGYIGTMLSNKLADDGHEVTVVDLFWFGDFLNNNVKKIKMNLIDLNVEQVSEYEAVVFMAGLSNDPMANFSPKKNFIENAAAPTYLSYICKKAGVKRFVYASSCSVYGFTDNKIMTEQDSVGPEYPYGISKLQTEFSIMNMESKNFRPISLRKGTVGGWSPRMRFDLVVNTMTKYALTENRIVVHNPNLWRPLVDVRDAVQAYEKSIFCDLKISGIFNISHSNYTIGELASNIKDVLADRGHNVQIETQNNPDVRNYLVSNDKARDILGYSPKYTPKQSVSEILDNIDPDIDFKDNKYYNIATFKEM
jgi:nucleoside-diphosphate-sugar epimerase